VVEKEVIPTWTYLVAAVAVIAVVAAGYFATKK